MDSNDRIFLEKSAEKNPITYLEFKDKMKFHMLASTNTFKAQYGEI